MAREQVHVTGHSAADLSSVWAVAGDFCGAWHPAIAEIRLERDARGAQVRAFKAKGEDTVYREQLVYRSDSDRVLSYIHLEGISGVESYTARLQVSPDENGGSRIDWSAQLSAAPERAMEIAAGTRAIFQMGIDALAKLETSGAPVSGTAGISPEDPADDTFETAFIEGDPRLALTVTPPRDGPLVLFLHGIGGGRSNWMPQLKAVAPNLRAAALDLRGYGESQPGSSQSNVDDYCADIVRAMEHMGADRSILCGLSYGSWIATSFAMRYPEKLAGLVLSGGCTGMSEAGIEERAAFRQSREIPLDQGRTPADFSPAVVNVIAGPDAGEDMRRQLLDSMAAIPVATYRDAIVCFTNPAERFDFSKLSMPVLMMTGEHDRLAPPAEIRAIAIRISEALPDACVRFEMIPGAGHVCNMEQPAIYNAILGEFLSELIR